LSFTASSLIADAYDLWGLVSADLTTAISYETVSGTSDDGQGGTGSGFSLQRDGYGEAPYSWIGNIVVDRDAATDPLVHGAVSVTIEGSLPIISNVAVVTADKILRFYGSLYRGLPGTYDRIEHIKNGVTTTFNPGDSRLTHTNGASAILDNVRIDGTVGDLFDASSNWVVRFIYDTPGFDPSWYNQPDMDPGWVAEFRTNFV
jgi:hypothetical protein